MRRYTPAIKFFFIVIMVVLNLSFWTSFNIFAEEKEAIQTYYPADISHKILPAAAIETEINRMKESIKKTGFFSTLNVYKAVRENDLSICNQAADAKDCKEMTQDYTVIKTMGEGNCDQLKNEEKRNICGQLKKDDCSAFSDWKKDMCEGFLKEDIDLVNKAFLSLEKGKFETNTVREYMAIFSGFKHYNSKMACERFGSKLSLPNQFICNVIFGTQDVNEILDKIALDVTLFSMAKKYGNSKLCGRITDGEIKKRCLDKTTTKVW